jgi:N-acetylglucosaminyl-diphospho-decaprenol L-rhamnosyltransferase
MRPPLISFVIVTYNSADSIAACLASIMKHTMAFFEVVVVDNSPDTKTADAVESFLGAHLDERFNLDKTGENLGFAKGCNRGAEATSGDFLFFLNPDTELLNDVVAEMLTCFDSHPSAFAVGPMIVGSDDAVTRTCRNLPTTGRILLDAVGIDQFVGAYRLTRFSHREPRKVEQIMGSAMLIPRHVYNRIGGMDERFFIYYEEVDLCKRLMEAQGEIWFWPTAKVRHLAGVSTDATSVRATMICVLRQSRTKYFRKHFGTKGELQINILNRLEGLGKGLVFGALALIGASASYREKSRGFLLVAASDSPKD